jgi:DNA-binding NarL/FixJ family response regulator
MRLVLADDAVLIREGLARLLAEAGFEVVAQAGDAAGLLRMVHRHQPDVAIIDIRMPPTHTDEGLRAALEIRGHHPGVGVLVLSQHVEPAYAIELLQSGTERVGYLLKERVAHLADLTDAVERVAAGGSALDPAIVAQLVARPGGDGDPLGELSAREREVLELMAEGRTNKAIGHRLWVTEHTVEKHVKNVMGKLRIPTGPDDHRRVLTVLRYLDSR